MRNKLENINDKYIILIGIPVLALVAFLIFGDREILLNSDKALLTLFYNIFFTGLMWLGIRQIVIFLWRKFPWEKFPKKHLIFEILIVTAYTFFLGTLTWFLFYYSGIITDDDESIKMTIFITLLITYLVTGLHEAWFFYTQWNISLLKAESLEKENIQSQYETLKSQINPHFLFNTLNTLSNLIDENPKLAVDYVDKTSDFLRSILISKDKELVSLSEELELIKTFYFLQRERYGDNLRLNITISDDYIELLLPPLSVQMLVENSIKHNVISADNPLQIEIGVEHDYLFVKNNYQPKIGEVKSSGIGLQNIKNRYNLLSGKSIKIENSSDFFIVRIPVLRVGKLASK